MSGAGAAHKQTFGQVMLSVQGQTLAVYAPTEDQKKKKVVAPIPKPRYAAIPGGGRQGVATAMYNDVHDMARQTSSCGGNKGLWRCVPVSVRALRADAVIRPCPST